MGRTPVSSPARSLVKAFFLTLMRLFELRRKVISRPAEGEHRFRSTFGEVVVRNCKTRDEILGLDGLIARRAARVARITHPG